MDALTSHVDTAPRRERIVGLIVFAAALTPALAAIALVPEFTTQDGPSHLYNARILNASLGAASPFAGTFEVAWQPLPNWAGHLATMAMVALLPADVAGRAVTGLTLVVFAGSVVWLRWAVAGEKGLATASVLAVLLGLNVTWLMGFTSFLLGAALMPATLAVWWGGREWFGLGRAAGLSVLLVLGYFCHPISLGLTVVGLGVLAAMSPGMDRVRRAVLTAMAGVPLVPLGLAYRSLTQLGGGMEPTWQHLGANPWSPRAWVAQIGWIDPISLAAKRFRPFDVSSSVLNAAIAPAFWVLAGVGVLTIATAWRRSTDRRGWLALSGLLLVAGLVGPDTLGSKHGHYLSQRVVLLGLVVLVPWLDLGAGRWSTRVGSAVLGVALVVQSAFVWDYAVDCRDRLGRFAKAGPALGRGARVGTLLVGIKSRFRSNPLLHADCQFGAKADDVVWSNYETAYYYFPVKVRPGLDHPPAPEFERVALLDGPADGPERARRWEVLIDEHLGAIDTILEWCPEPDLALDAINARHYDRSFIDGPVRVWNRRPSLTRAGRLE
jgi:hypothetical protein